MKAFLLSLFLLIPVLANSADKNPKKVPASLQSAYLIKGFDTNDRSQIIINGEFADTCYQVGPYKRVVDTKKKEIRIFQSAYLHDGMCMDVIVPFQQIVELDLVKEKGDYDVYDGVSKKKLGVFKVKEADGPGPGSDDHPYAPVSDIEIREGEKGRELVLTGDFSNSCIKFKNVEVLPQPKDSIVVVKPIVEEKKNSTCEPGVYPFTQIEPMKPLAEGTYLFHIRLMSGQALNKMVTLGEN